MSDKKEDCTVITIPASHFAVVCSILAGLSMFLVGKRIGQEEALHIIRPVTCVMKMGDTPVVRIQVSTDPDTSKLIENAINFNVSGASGMPTNKQLKEWIVGSKFVVGRNGQWEQREGRCTDQDLNCMD